jgi:hypothetical protein
MVDVCNLERRGDVSSNDDDDDSFEYKPRDRPTSEIVKAGSPSAQLGSPLCRQEPTSSIRAATSEMCQRRTSYWRSPDNLFLMLFRRLVGYGGNGIAFLEALRPKRDLPIAEYDYCQAAICRGACCPAATCSGVEPVSGQHSLGGASIPKPGVPAWAVRPPTRQCAPVM